MINITQKYQEYCLAKGIPFTLADKVNPYDDTTLFCPAGMQQFKPLFKDTAHTGTVANIQSCIRMNDFGEIGDTTHLLYFNMIGLFSFRQMPIRVAIEFWVEFITKELGLKLSYVTIHPDKFDEWQIFYKQILCDIDIRPDKDCQWTDGDIGGYCTEFFINDVEIGNIVNPLGNCIDVGFGLERLEMFVNKDASSLVMPNGSEVSVLAKESTLKSTILKIIESGYVPGNLKQGYVLRKLLRELHSIGGTLDHPFFEAEIQRQKTIADKYQRLKLKHADKPKEWWFDTHGINLDEIR